MAVAAIARAFPYATEGTRPQPRLCVRANGSSAAGQPVNGAARQPGSDITSNNSSATEGPLELKGGALWWQHLHAGAASTAPLYGTNFVLQRPRIGGPGLVRAVRHPKPVVKPPPTPASPPMVWSAPGKSGGLMLAGGSLGSGAIVIDTEYEVLPAGEPAATGVQPNTTCFGIVWQRSEDSEVKEPLPRRSSKHPRRTQALRFTCNLCGEVNDAAVNPHAWRKGSVFARCQGCTAVHKLKDNLRIFHELSGPVFPPRELRANYLVQEILDRIKDNNNSN